MFNFFVNKFYFIDKFEANNIVNLDKRTLVFLRWLAIFGQLISVNLVYFILDLSFPVFECHLIILFLSSYVLNVLNILIILS